MNGSGGKRERAVPAAPFPYFFDAGLWSARSGLHFFAETDIMVGESGRHLNAERREAA